MLNKGKNEWFVICDKLKTVYLVWKLNIDEYKKKNLGLQTDFKFRLEDLKSWKSIFAHFVNLFIWDIEDGFTISEIILVDKVTGELE